jgi:hypothetical protein
MTHVLIKGNKKDIVTTGKIAVQQDRGRQREREGEKERERDRERRNCIFDQMGGDKI